MRRHDRIIGERDTLKSAAKLSSYLATGRPLVTDVCRDGWRGWQLGCSSGGQTRGYLQKRRVVFCRAPLTFASLTPWHVAFAFLPSNESRLQLIDNDWLMNQEFGIASSIWVFAP